MNKLTKTDNPQVTGLDGFPRNKNLEEEISLNLHTFFHHQLVKLFCSIYEVLQ